MNRLSAALLAGLLLGPTGLSQVAAPPPLFLEIPQGVLASVRPANANSSRSRVVRLDAGLIAPGRGSLQQPGTRLTANFFDDAEHVIRVDRVDLREPGTFSCLGHVENVPGSSVVLAAVDGALAGTITLPGSEPFQVQCVGEGLHRVSQVNHLTGDWCATTSLPARSDATNPDAAFRAALPAGLPSAARTAATATEPAVIDFLVLYTPRARAGAGGEAGVNALLDFAVAENNFCYANSGIQARWNIVGRHEIEYADSGDITTDWKWLQADPNVAALKLAHRADVVLLVVEFDRFGWAGVAAPSSAGQGYAVFLRPGIASGDYLVAHEVGHLLGAGHDRFTCTSRGSRAGCGAFYPAYSYGHRFEADGMTYVTVMSYAPGIYVPHFSNPSVLFRGVPTGVAVGFSNAADNAQTINQVAPFVANAMQVFSQFSLATNAVTVSEGARSVAVEVRRTGSVNLPGTVECVTVAGTATELVDFTPATNLLAFAPGQEQQTVTIPILDDALGEGDETFGVSLRRPALGMALGADSSATVTIRDDDAWVALPATNIVVAEGSGSVDIPVRRGGDTNVALNVAFTTVPGTATAGDDFIPAAGILAFAPGQTEQVIRVAIRADGLVERDEQFTVTLDQPVGGGIAPPGRVNVVIVDAERPGSLDPSFPGLPDLAQASHSAFTIDPEGRILLAGRFRMPGGSERMVLRRYLSNGSIDPAFAPAEFANTTTAEPGVAPARVFTVVLDAAGRILVGGRFAAVDGTPRGNVVRLHPDGGVDGSFQAGADGYTMLALHPLGKLLLSGAFHRVNGVPRPYLARLNDDGTLDPTFDPRPNADTLALGNCAVQTDGRILVSGLFWGFEGSANEYCARLNSDGSLDRSFRARPDGSVQKIALLPDQRIFMAGGFTTPRGGMARLQPDGSLDPTFDPGSLLNAPINDFLRLPDGRVLVSGMFTTVGATRQNYLLRLNPDGSLDATFDSGFGPDDAAGFLAREAGGSVLVSGRFATINGLPAPYLARLRGDCLPPTLGPIRLLADGQLRLRLAGKAGCAYEVQVSHDLSGWTRLRSGTLETGVLEWDEANGADIARYFRARTVEP